MPPTVAYAEGDRFGPYALVQRLGRGAMGEVWAATLHGPGGFAKPVALKLLRPDRLHDQTQRDALVREARLGARLHHPNIVATYGLSRHDEAWVVALELVRGATLSELLRSGGALAPRAVLDVGMQAAAGLAHAHQAGLVHRDIKPSNLMVDTWGLVKLTDLGVSVLRGQERVVAGTLGYMAPEQLDGKAVPQSDLFALGATLYVLATGTRPFGRGTQALLVTRKLAERLADPTFLEPVERAVPGLGAVLVRCLQPDPLDRWPSSRMLGVALGALFDQQAEGERLMERLATVRDELVVDAVPSSLWPARARSDVRTIPGNLPRFADAFVGRQDEVDALRTHLADPSPSWVLLTGSGGVGKTRLALEVARAVADRFPGGTWWVDLAEARTEDGVRSATARALGLRPDPVDPGGQLAHALAARGRALWVFDNADGCVDALPTTVGAWLSRAAEAVAIATARRVTGLAGERIQRVGPLLPDDAVALFEARAARPLTDEDRTHLLALCDALDGVPLGVELAAARARLMGVRQIRERLGLRLLSGRDPLRPARQRSLSASLDWSAELLDAPLRQHWHALVVFEGTFDPGAAMAVLDTPHLPGTMRVLAQLVDAGLVRAHGEGGGFSLHAIVREYCAARIDDPLRRAAERRHAAYFAQLGGRDPVARLDGADGVARRAALALALDDLVVACRRAVDLGDADVAVGCLRGAWAVMLLAGPFELAAALAANVRGIPALTSSSAAEVDRIAGSALRLAGYPERATEHLERAAAAGDDGVAADAWLQLGRLAQEQGRAEPARAALSQALDAFRRAGRPAGVGATLLAQGNVHIGQGRADAARRCYEEALQLYLALGHLRGAGDAHGSLGAVHVVQGRPAEGLRHATAALHHHRQVGHRRGQIASLAALGALERRDGRFDQARERWSEGLALARRIGARRMEGLLCGNLGNLGLQTGDHDDALDHYQRALALHRALGNRQYEGVVLCNLGELHLQAGNADAAAESLEAALAAHRDAGDRRGTAVSLALVGRQRMRTGRLEDAGPHLADAVADLRDVGDPRHLGQALGWLAQVELASGRPAAAGALLDEGEAVLRDAGDRAMWAGILVARAHWHRAGGRAAAARACLDEAVAVAPPEAMSTQAEIAEARAGLGAPPIDG